MNEQAKKTVGVMSSVLLLASAGAAGFAAMPQDAFAGDGAIAELPASEADQATAFGLERVEGIFSFSQSVITPVPAIQKSFAAASRHICGSGGSSEMLEVVDPAQWSVSVGGDVQNAFSATLGEMAKEGSAQLVMGCTCAGNPADGQATANAEVLGVRLAYIMFLAQPDEGVNTVRFTSSDGHEVALPLSYVQNHFSLIAFDLNGEPIANSMGGSNQLWLGSTAASYFLRNVTDITFEQRQTPPPTPGTEEAGDSYANLPNVNIVGGESA